MKFDECIDKDNVSITEYEDQAKLEITLKQFAVPSWNRILNMHHMEKNKLVHLTGSLIRLHYFGDRTNHKWMLADYFSLIRPSKKRKEEKKDIPKEEIEYFHIPKTYAITERPALFAFGVSLEFHHKRNRLIDLDNLCVKQVVDGLVMIGLLKDDAPEYVNSITQTQEKVAANIDREYALFPSESLHITIKSKNLNQIRESGQ